MLLGFIDTDKNNTDLIAAMSKAALDYRDRLLFATVDALGEFSSQLIRLRSNSQVTTLPHVVIDDYLSEQFYSFDCSNFSEPGDLSETIPPVK